MKLLRRGGVRLIVAWRHRKSTGSVVARVVLPGDQVVPIHAIRDQVVIVFTSACFARLGGGTPIPSAPSSGSVTIIPTRHDKTATRPKMIKLVLEEGYKRQATTNGSSRPRTCMFTAQGTKMITRDHGHESSGSQRGET